MRKRSYHWGSCVKRKKQPISGLTFTVSDDCSREKHIIALLQRNTKLEAYDLLCYLDVNLQDTNDQIKQVTEDDSPLLTERLSRESKKRENNN